MVPKLGLGLKPASCATRPALRRLKAVIRYPLHARALLSESCYRVPQLYPPELKVQLVPHPHRCRYLPGVFPQCIWTPASVLPHLYLAQVSNPAPNSMVGSGTGGVDTNFELDCGGCDARGRCPTCV